MPTQHPTTIQELFDFAIRQSVTVNGEFGGRRDAFKLYRWANEFAKKHGLEIPIEAEAFGIYYPPEEDELAAYPFLRNLEY